FDSDQDYMKGSLVAPSSNPNSYPMTDERLFPSRINIYVNGEKLMETTLPDDPADHRGVLSWHAQIESKEIKYSRLQEAGSYGFLVKLPISRKQFRDASRKGMLKIDLRTQGEGGLAVYGKDFGRYPLDPTLVLKK
ncbi:MAG: glycoside hydrolase family 2, partial [Bacteroidota bacterium]